MGAIRTCVGCGERAPQGVLIRMTVGAAGLVPDPRRRAPGRGAYLHPSPTCWQAFARRRGPVRSLGVAPAPREREELVLALAASAGQVAR